MKNVLSCCERPSLDDTELPRSHQDQLPRVFRVLSLFPVFLIDNFNRPQCSCGKVMFFTPVCDSVHGGGRGSGRHSARQTPPRRRPLQWTVRIILECILVFFKFKFVNGLHQPCSHSFLPSTD